MKERITDLERELNVVYAKERQAKVYSESSFMDLRATQSAKDAAEGMIQTLQKQCQELELINNSNESKISEMEHELTSVCLTKETLEKRLQEQEEYMRKSDKADAPRDQVIQVKTKAE